jgi:uncharacterized protein YbbC (DUF1343 family)
MTANEMISQQLIYYDNLLNHPIYRTSNNIVLFCNQSSFDFSRKKYLFDLLIEQHKLNRILIPEHGLFSEYQDQINVKSLNYKGIPCTSLYNKIDGDTAPSENMFQEADAVLIDILDAGVRYYTYTTHLFSILSLIAQSYKDLPLLIINRTNPIGTKVEGTIIDERYTSFLGHGGLIHRHGLTTVELCQWYLSKNQLSLNLIEIPFRSSPKHFIPPSPNLPTRTSLSVYPGQCLWEATTLSEGRGTTRPFELFGHPGLSIYTTNFIAEKFNARFEDLAILRPTYFIPVDHKHKGVLCRGWHLFIEDTDHYHSIQGTLYIMRLIIQLLPEIEFWITGPYEFDSPYSAAQLLFGDDELIHYVCGEKSEEDLIEYMNTAEEAWKLADGY